MSSWTNNIEGNENWVGEQFATRNEAIADGLKQHAAARRGKATELFYGCKDIPDSFLVGRITEWCACVDGGALIDQARDDAYEAAEEYSEDFLANVSREQENELSQKVQVVFDEWLTRYHLHPSFHIIDPIEKIDVKMFDEVSIHG